MLGVDAVGHCFLAGGFPVGHLRLGLSSGRPNPPSGYPGIGSFSGIQLDGAGWSQALTEVSALLDRAQDHSMGALVCASQL